LAQQLISFLFSLCLQEQLGLKVRLAAHDLGCINSIHLSGPALRGHNLAHSPHFIRRIAWDTNIVVALEYDLNVADVELRRITELGKLAGVAYDVVDEIVSKLEDGLD
jgi:hypothetical protein